MIFTWNNRVLQFLNLYVTKILLLFFGTLFLLTTHVFIYVFEYTSYQSWNWIDILNSFLHYYLWFITSSQHVSERGTPVSTTAYFLTHLILISRYHHSANHDHSIFSLKVGPSLLSLIKTPSIVGQFFVPHNHQIVIGL